MATVDLDVDTTQLRQAVKEVKQAAKTLVDKADAALAMMDEPLTISVTPVQEPPPPPP